MPIRLDHWSSRTPDAVVYRADRRARAESMVERVNNGREYGDGFEAMHRQVGPEHRVYARYLGNA